MSDLFGTDYDGRKAIPIFEGVLMYFPKAIAAVAEVSHAGNQQHNPGAPLHWARGKSMDQYNTAVRHLMDHRMGGGRAVPFTPENNGWVKEPKDKDGVRHLAKAAWRVLAALELAIEEEEAQKVEETATARAEHVQEGGFDPAALGLHSPDECKCGAMTFSRKPGDLPPTVIKDGETHSPYRCTPRGNVPSGRAK